MYHMQDICGISLVLWRNSSKFVTVLCQCQIFRVKFPDIKIQCKVLHGTHLALFPLGSLKDSQ